MRHNGLILFTLFSSIFLMSSCGGGDLSKANKMVGIYDVSYANNATSYSSDEMERLLGAEWFFAEDSILHWGQTDSYGLPVPTRWEIQNNILIIFEQYRNGEVYPYAYLIKEIDGNNKMELYLNVDLLKGFYEPQGYGHMSPNNNVYKSSFREYVREHESAFESKKLYLTLTRNKEKEQEFEKAKKQEEKLEKELKKLLGED